MATKKKTATKKTPRKKKLEADPGTRGLEPADLVSAKPPAAVTDLARTVESDRGKVLGAYRDPVGGDWQLVAALKQRGVEGSSVRGFVITHVNLLHGDRSRQPADFDQTLKKMLAAVKKFDVEAVNPEDLARLGGGYQAEE